MRCSLQSPQIRIRARVYLEAFVLRLTVPNYPEGRDEYLAVNLTARTPIEI